MANKIDDILVIEPENTLNFNLTKDRKACSCTLTLTNTKDHALAYKIKITKPKRYLVKPKQGLIEKFSTVTISIILIERECIEFVKQIESLHMENMKKVGNNPENNDGNEENNNISNNNNNNNNNSNLNYHILPDCLDKFQVQAFEMSDDEFANVEKLRSNAKTIKEQNDSMSELWNTVSDNNLHTSRFRVQIDYPELMKAHPQIYSNTHPNNTHHSNISSSSPLSSSKYNSDRNNTNITNNNNNNKISQDAEKRYHEVQGLRQKYEKLVEYTIRLTAERDVLLNAVDAAKSDLRKELTAKNEMENNSNKNNDNDNDNLHKRRNPSGISPMASMTKEKNSTTGNMMKPTEKNGVGILFVLGIGLAFFLIGRAI